MDSSLRYHCPRCGTEVAERFYGPCAGCRVALQEIRHAPDGEVRAERYEPKMNVVPNHVATKD